MKAVEQLPSQRINVIFKLLLSQAAAEQQCPVEQLPIQVVLAARLEAHERYFDMVEQPPSLVSLQ